MKKLFLLGISVIAVMLLSAQPPAVGSTRHYPELDKYAGTWLWQSGNESIEIKFKKIFYDNGEFTHDILLGVHKYIKNGVIVEDNLSLYNELGQGKKGSLYVWVDWHNPNPDKLMGTAKDVLKRRYHYIYIEYLGGTPAQIKCSIQEKGTTITDPTLEGQTLPVGNLIFTKQ